MKTLLNTVIFGSIFFVALTSENSLNASERGFFRTGREVSTTMLSEHPISTVVGSYYLGSDFIRSMIGKAPRYLLHLTVNDSTWNYYKDGQLTNTLFRRPV